MIFTPTAENKRLWYLSVRESSQTENANARFCHMLRSLIIICPWSFKARERPWMHSCFKNQNSEGVLRAPELPGLKVIHLPCGEPQLSVDRDRGIRGDLGNCVSHIGSFPPGPDAIFKKSCKFYTLVQNVNLKQDAVKTAFWNNVRFVDLLSPYERIARGKFTLQDPRGDFFPSTQCLGLIKISPQTSRKLDEAGCTKETQIH